MQHAREDYQHIQEWIDPRLAYQVGNILSSSLSLAEATARIDEAFKTFSDTCRIPNGEPVFLIRAQDKCAVSALSAWVKTARANGVPSAMLSAVERQIQLIREWQFKVKVKVPDLPAAPTGHDAGELARDQASIKPDPQDPPVVQ